MPWHSRARSLVVCVAALSALMLNGCALTGTKPIDPIDSRIYASGSAYVYQPLNPTTIWVRDPEPCELGVGETAADYASPEFKHALLRDLDTETVRVSLATVSANGSANAGIVGMSVKGDSYVLIIDYIKYFTTSTRIRVSYNEPGSTAGTTVAKTIDSDIPVYSGVGVRIRAEFVALAGNLNISGLPGLSAAASNNQITGRLTVQTLGITGPDVTALMPLISDVSVASIQNAVQAVAAIKAKLYEDSTVAYPKIVGFESPTSNTEAITKITAALYSLNESVVPRMSPNPVKEGQKTLWIAWFPTRAERNCPAPVQAAGPSR